MFFKMSRKGRYHREKNLTNQDFVTGRETDRFIVLSLADGISSCKYARKGAKIACNTAEEMLLNHGERFFSIESYDAINCILSKIRHEIEKEAKHDIEQYSCTLICILYDKQTHKIFYFSFGDSLIMAIEKDRCKILAQPFDSRNGIPSITSRFAENIAHAGVTDANFESLMLCSDGAWNLMYKKGSLDTEIKKILINKNFNALKSFLKEKNGFDDCSFIAVNLSEQEESHNARPKKHQQEKLPSDRRRYNTYL